MTYRVVMNWDFKGASGDDVYKKAKDAIDGHGGTWTKVTSGLDGSGSYEDVLDGIVKVVQAIRSNKPATGSLRHINITVISQNGGGSTSSATQAATGDDAALPPSPAALVFEAEAIARGE